MARPLPEFLGTDRFLIVRQLGAGGYGVVYEAIDRQRNAHVALKMLHRADARHIYGLKQEFRSLAEISHPNLVSLYELLSAGDRWFFTMELVSGRDFVQAVRVMDQDTPTPEVDSRAQMLASDALTAEVTPTESSETLVDPVSPNVDFARIRDGLTQLVDGLGYLHGLGKLHRDIKSANVLITREGRLVLLDFGLVADFDSRGTDASMNLAGTPMYMAPERLEGKQASPAADWYAVGVLVFRALTGRHPFVGNPLEVWEAKRERDPPAPREFAPDVPDDLNGLCQALLARDPERRPAADEILARLTGERRAPVSRTSIASPGRRTPFVGRQVELHALDAAYAAAQEGRAVTVYVSGASGIGKTALVRHFLEELQRRQPEALVLSGRCYERESVPYKALDALVDALSRSLRGMTTPDVEALLPRDIAALARLFPVLLQVDAVASKRQRTHKLPESQELRRRAFSAFREMLGRIADRRPLVMFIDDLQWGDADSAAMLAGLLQPPDPPPLLLIASYRSEESDRIFLPSLLEHHRTPTADGDVRELVVTELGPGEAHDLSVVLIGSSGAQSTARAETIARESRGNPFLIDELARYAVEHQSPAAAPLASTFGSDDQLTVDTVISARVAALPGPARRLLELLAVSGRPLNVAIAREAADLRSTELEALSMLRARRLIRVRSVERTEQVEPYHDRVRETVLKQLSAPATQSHHRRLAEALEAARHPDPETLAIHFHGAGQPERASQYAILAATQAGEALAFDRAARLYRFALELHSPSRADRKRLQTELGDALSYAGRGREAAQAYQAAASAADAPLDELELRRRAGEQLLRSGHIDDGFAVMQGVLREIGIELAIGPKRAMLSLLWHRLLIRLKGLRFRERDASQIAPMELFKVDACWSVAKHVGMIDTIRGTDFQARQLLLACRVGDLPRVTRAISAEVAYSAVTGTRSARRTQKLLAMAETLAGRVGDAQSVGFVNVMKGMAANMQGRWKDSLESGQRAEKMLRDEARGIAWELDLVYLYSLLDLQFMGELPELRRRLAQFLAEARERDDLNAITNLRTRLAYVPHLAADEPDQAQLEIIRGIRQWSQQGFQLQHYYVLFAYAEVILYMGGGLVAWRMVDSNWAALKRSLILHSQNIRIEALHLRGRAALGAAADSADARARRQFLRTAAGVARRILKDRAEWAFGQAYLLRAGTAAAHGDTAGAIAELAAAERALTNADMNLHAAVARRRRGELLGAGAGAALVEDADAWMRSREIRNPLRMAALLAPGEYPDGRKG